MEKKYKTLGLIFNILGLSTFLVFGLGIIFCVQGIIFSSKAYKHFKDNFSKINLALAIFASILNVIFLVITMFLLYYYYNF